MKTAMQELITELKYVEEWPMISGIIKRANDLLEKEKEQMLSEWKKGFEDAKYIYEQTYNQNK